MSSFQCVCGRMWMCVLFALVIETDFFFLSSSTWSSSSSLNTIFFSICPIVELLSICRSIWFQSIILHLQCSRLNFKCCRVKRLFLVPRITEKMQTVCHSRPEFYALRRTQTNKPFNRFLLYVSFRFSSVRSAIVNKPTIMLCVLVVLLHNALFSQ